ncbi:MAG: ABC transporter substrate-binding protein [Cyclobacteriaceae bacterium]|jgi:iron complex transport system substrate-binding protein|nr:ABC transporter substrate-binding protein [Cyclobacteriaceae bacterium]
MTANSRIHSRFFPSFAAGTWALVVILMACGRDQPPTAATPGRDSLRYATGFRLQREGTVTRVTVTYPHLNATEGYSYLLVPKGTTPPQTDKQTTIIEVPVSSLVCTSTTHIPLLDYLGGSHVLIGFPTTDYISSPVMRQRIDAGKVADLGIDKGMDLERLFSLKPEVVMGYTMTKDLGQLRKISDLGIPVVINAEYLEKHPLGRAEWIKLMGALLGREKQADSVFAMIENEYLRTQALVTDTRKPTVFSGIAYGDGWFLPGGQNYAARLLRDAGYDYLWQADSTQGYLELSFEAVYTRAKHADYWIGVASYTSRAEIKNTDSRYALFDAFQNKRVYSYNARTGAKGGSEFLELGYLRPDLILKDLVKIAHPQLLPRHTLYFHRALP